MTYATPQDMIDRFGEEELIQLTDRLDSGVLDDAVLDRALADAAAVIDGHLVGRYADQMPLVAVPPILVGYHADLARELLYVDAVPEAVTRRADLARRFLEQVAKGDILLGVAPAPTGGNTVQTMSATRPVRGLPY